MKTAISYQRFSSGEQAKGDSENRQITAFQSFCQAFDLTPANTMIDRGFSGFHGEHKAKGEFGRFLGLLQAGKIPSPKNTVLVVEAWDRLSREMPDVALATVKEIMLTGVEIGVVSMGRIFTLADIDSYQLFAIIGSMIEARQSSKLKSERTKANVKRLCKSGMITKFGVKSGACPSWLTPSGNTWVFNPIADLVKQAIKLAIAGNGAMAIKAEVVGCPVGITSIMRQICLLGLFQPMERTGKNSRKPDGEPYLLYPPLIDEATFRKLQMALDSRVNIKGRRGTYVTNLFTGLIVYPTATVMSGIAGLEAEKNKLSLTLEKKCRENASPVTTLLGDAQTLMQALEAAKGTDSLLDVRTRLKSLVRGIVKEISVKVTGLRLALVKVRFHAPLERWIKIEGETSKVVTEGDVAGFRKFLGVA